MCAKMFKQGIGCISILEYPFVKRISKEVLAKSFLEIFLAVALKYDLRRLESLQKFISIFLISFCNIEFTS